jgi:hypothetical protein
MRVAEKYLTEENRTVAWLVETESEGGDEGEVKVDLRAIMMWVQTLPEEEQRELMGKFMTLDEAGKKIFAWELSSRMKADQEKS